MRYLLVEGSIGINLTTQDVAIEAVVYINGQHSLHVGIKQPQCRIVHE